jgi:RHH-type proline utilization regulon transcriptional repressor/proline dehydrogenase/delta 1-pyrroline-5-carboxylate dehydrogenase
MEAIFQNKFTNQGTLVKQQLLPDIQLFHNKFHDQIKQGALEIIQSAKNYKSHNAFEKLMYEYDLSSNEGIVLMCLAEALLRIPDTKTINDLIEDKIPRGDWKDHIKNDNNLFVNISSLAFLVTGKIVKRNDLNEKKLFKSLIKNLSEPVLRSAIKKAINILAKQFIFEKDIQRASTLSEKLLNTSYAYSFDMLGEAALTYEDADLYFQNYMNAINVIGNSNSIQQHSISIKLSALHPRYERNKIILLEKELLPKLFELIEKARICKVDVCFDAEESDRLNLSLLLVNKILESNLIDKGYFGFGMAVQAYQQRSMFVLEYLSNKLNTINKKMNIRLVKGAYWDTEIKLAQEQGLPNYPVFTKKFVTDLSYLKCAHILEKSENIFSQFATHNAYTISYVQRLFGNKPHEFQKLHGMGDEIYNHFLDQNDFRCRIYAPVGGYNDLLPYLVRRLLENGANTSFIHQLNKKDVNIENLIQSPLDKIEKLELKEIEIPLNLFTDRKNSLGVDLSEEDNITLYSKLESIENIEAYNIIEGRDVSSQIVSNIGSPYLASKVIGKAFFADTKIVDSALQSLNTYSSIWKNEDINKRIDIINNFSNLLELNKLQLVSACVKEAGKTIPDAIADIREAIDFCRYYGVLAKDLFREVKLPGPTGEKNIYRFKGKGLSIVISPWNFPIAIFTGQLVAALISGNVVLAKPAEQTSYCAYIVFKLLLKAGLPNKAAALLLGRGEEIGPQLFFTKQLKNIIFTGSLETAKNIQKQLAKRTDILNLIAETGGLNCLIADSSALTEHVVQDVINSSFNSAGQRCSACRILCVEEHVYKQTLKMLKGAIDTLEINNPEFLSTDLGPVIDSSSKEKILNHIKNFSKTYQRKHIPEDGHFISPTIIEISSLREIKEEIFGPVVHIISYKAKNTSQLCEEINELGYGLTLGIHSRIDSTINIIIENVNIGNIYVNRNMVGAVVGVQPFGGHGKSGTGPKAGGPQYLKRLCNEYSVSNNITAMGGNTTLLSSISD